MSLTKACTRCGEEKGTDKFRPQRRVCMACEAAASKRWAQANPERQKFHSQVAKQKREASAEWQRKQQADLQRKREVSLLAANGKGRCSACGEVKDFGDFHLRSDDGRPWSGMCRACANERNKRLYQAAPEVKKVVQITDAYVVSKLRQAKRASDLPKDLIPQQMIEAKRMHLRLMRLLKERRK